MAKRAQDIKVAVHLPENLDSVFNSKEAVEFWRRAYGRLLHENGITDREQLEKLLEEARKEK